LPNIDFSTDLSAFSILMKPSMFPRMAAVSILSAISPLSAQNLTSAPRNSEVSVKVDDFDETCDSRFAASSPIPGSYEVPSLNKAKGEISEEGQPAFPGGEIFLSVKSLESQRAG
jgi:hypothetical protein